jgi:hypothetical protein
MALTSGRNVTSTGIRLGGFKWLTTGQVISYSNWRYGDLRECIPNSSVSDVKDLLSHIYMCTLLWQRFNCELQYKLY